SRPPTQNLTVLPPGFSGRAGKWPHKSILPAVTPFPPGGADRMAPWRYPLAKPVEGLPRGGGGEIPPSGTPCWPGVGADPGVRPQGSRRARRSGLGVPLLRRALTASATNGQTRWSAPTQRQSPNLYHMFAARLFFPRAAQSERPRTLIHY